MTLDLDLAQVAAGLPMALSLALAGGISTLREGRRRSALNEAMHELRRPLQVLLLGLTSETARVGSLESSLWLTMEALDRLDREINGATATDSCDRLEIEPLVGAAVARWQVQASALDRSLSVAADASSAVVRGDRVQLAQVLDNMISNALVHGSGEVLVEVRSIEERVRISVVDGGSNLHGHSFGRAGLRARLSGRCRHGHGLRVVGKAARIHGGVFRLRSSSAGTEARLELPLDRSAGRA